MSAADCQGTWEHPRALADGTVEVLSCTGCGEHLVTYRGRGYDFPKGATERQILTTIWAAVGRSIA